MILGRPKKLAKERRRNKIQLSFTDAELKEVEGAASDSALGTWIVEVTLKAARRATRSERKSKN